MSSAEYDKTPFLDLTNPVEYDDYNAYMIDIMTRVDTYKNLNALSVKVVSPPIPIINGIQPNVPGDLKNNPFGQIQTQIMFRGRIQGDNFISAHQLLEDPCNPTKFIGNDEALSQVINAHMLCISKVDSFSAMPRIGDIVTANATVGQAGPIDVQFCYFDSIEQKISNEAVAASAVTDQCLSAKAIFNATGSLPGQGLTYTPDPAKSPFLLNAGKENEKNWDSIELHSTVTQNAADAIVALRNRGLSYHYLVEKDGSVINTVDTKFKAWHGAVKGGIGPPSNTISIGISLVNLAYTASQFAGKTVVFSSGKQLLDEFPSLPRPLKTPPIEEWKSYDSNVTKKWEPIPQAQIQGLITIVKQLVAAYPNIKTYYCHEDNRAAGKEDPGPAFDIYRDNFEKQTGLKQDPRFPRSVKNRSLPLISSPPAKTTT
tara:strand:+ start:10673 stop:11959 length:1287 start_codon:yes stop_codon:yes gene_type:complete